MKQFKATQNSPQYGTQSLHVRFIGKLMFIKGAQNSTKYVDKLVSDFEKKGASIMKGNGGWLRIDIVKDNLVVKLGDIEIDREFDDENVVEQKMYDFFSKKYSEAKFVIQEIEE